MLVRIACSVCAALPCFVMGRQLYRVWRDPFRYDDGRWVRFGVAIFVLEFILAHSGVAVAVIASFQEDLLTRAAAIAGISAVYGLFAVAVSLGFKSKELFLSYLWVMGGRSVAYSLAAGSQMKRFLIANSVVAVALYVLAVYSTLLPLPRGGIRGPRVSAIMADAGTGHFVDYPHRVILVAAFYYFALALVEVCLLSWWEPRW